MQKESRNCWQQSTDRNKNADDCRWWQIIRTEIEKHSSLLLLFAERRLHISREGRDLVFAQCALEGWHVVFSVRDLILDLRDGHFLYGIRIQVGSLKALARGTSGAVRGVANDAIGLEALRRCLIRIGPSSKTERTCNQQYRCGNCEFLKPIRIAFRLERFDLHSRTSEVLRMKATKSAWCRAGRATDILPEHPALCKRKRIPNVRCGRIEHGWPNRAGVLKQKPEAGLPITRIQRKLSTPRCSTSGRGSAWLERLVRDQEAGGSNPLAPTKLFNILQRVERLVFRLRVVEIVDGEILSVPQTMSTKSII